ncbi:hypothetical protein PRIPAC_71052 [Pristionchus pacificus]|uniref:HEAT domain-containing protein n=1 Tax=Pristionchus pacificus TaxID=54126 RepID=A0A2A6C8H9_PRIPA|nr:hypothetical protein PRIPAC_71052 [Pristionchus pacificus]|eukprot:PDM74406.1 HEAT domain-containing protein [Pristionchus pacificus]
MSSANKHHRGTEETDNNEEKLMDLIVRMADSDDFDDRLWYPFEWSTIKDVLVESIFGSDPSLRKPAITVLKRCIRSKKGGIDEETVKMVLPIVIMEAEKGCCALVGTNGSDIEIYGAGLGNIKCNATHAAALSCLYSVLQITEETMISEHVARIFAIGTETIFNSNDCKKKATHLKSLKMIAELSEKYPHLIPATLIYDILASCLLSIVKLLNNNYELDKWMAFNPAIEEHDSRWPWEMTMGSYFMHRIVAQIGREKVCEPLERLTRSFLNDDDWKRRCAALIGWSVVEDDIRDERANFLFARATALLKDDHPRVRNAAAYLLIIVSPLPIHELEETISSLMSLLDDPVPRVAAMAITALSYLPHSAARRISRDYAHLLPLLTAILADCPEGVPTEMHKDTLRLVGTIAEDLEKDRFMPYFPAIEGAVCSILTLIDASSEHFERLCEMGGLELKRICGEIRNIPANQIKRVRRSQLGTVSCVILRQMRVEFLLGDVLVAGWAVHGCKYNSAFALE